MQQRNPMVVPNFGGYQDPTLNRGGPGNPGTASNMPRRQFGNSQTDRFQNPNSPYAGSGQRRDLGRYAPPMMEGNNWRDRGGYAYNLPNSFGPRPDFGEFNSPAMPRFGRGGGRGWGQEEPGMAYPMYEGPGNPRWERDNQQPGGGSPDGGMGARLERLREMLRGMQGYDSGSGVQAGATPEADAANAGAGPRDYAGGMPPGAIPSPAGGYVHNGVHYQSNGKPVGPAQDTYSLPEYPGSKPGDDSGYKGPEAIDEDPRPDPRTDPAEYNYWMHRQTTRGGQPPQSAQPSLPEFRTQNDFDLYRWASVRPNYWPEG